METTTHRATATQENVCNPALGIHNTSGASMAISRRCANMNIKNARAAPCFDAWALAFYKANACETRSSCRDSAKGDTPR
eukprot:7492137-Alexandrium_andersonii.AAC.1